MEKEASSTLLGSIHKGPPLRGEKCTLTTESHETLVVSAVRGEPAAAGAADVHTAGIYEWSPCCVFLGLSGSTWGAKHRKRVIMLAFFLSTLSWVFTLYPMLATSMNADVIISTAWAKGSLFFERADGSFEASVYVGLRALVEEIDCEEEEDDREECEAWVQDLTKEQEQGNGGAGPFEPLGDGLYRRTLPWAPDGGTGRCSGGFVRRCSDCRDSAAGSVSFAIIGAVLMVPQIMTDFQRSTVHCYDQWQAVVGFLTAAFGFVSNVLSLQSFLSGCWSTLPVELNGNPFEWRLGAALLCFVAATALKGLDALSHLLVAAPAAGPAAAGGGGAGAPGSGCCGGASVGAAAAPRPRG